MPIAPPPQLKAGLFARGSGTLKPPKATATGAPPAKGPKGIPIENRIGIQAAEGDLGRGGLGLSLGERQDGVATPVRLRVLGAGYRLHRQDEDADRFGIGHDVLRQLLDACQRASARAFSASFIAVKPRRTEPPIRRTTVGPMRPAKNSPLETMQLASARLSISI